MSLEVWEGIEPSWVDLQSTAWPLRHQTITLVIGAHDGNRTHLDLLDRQVISPEIHMRRYGARGWDRTTDAELFRLPLHH